MNRLKKIVFCASILSLATAMQAFALVGIGVHYGMDYTLSMKNTAGLGDRVTFDNLNLDLGQGAGSVLAGDSIPAFVSRSDFKSKFAVGGKVYIDVIPFIDALELSGDFGLWEYKGVINYPSSLKPASSLNTSNFADTGNFNYTQEELTLQNFGLGYMGLKNTPYAKLQLDLTVRKYIVRFPSLLKILNLYGGAGVSGIFATPVLSNKLVQDVINESAQGTKSINSLGTDVLGNSSIMQGVVKKIISGLTQPTFGMHLDLGLMVKIPVIPIGVYIDGKYIIPFSKLDPSVDIGGMGFVLNTGIALAF